MGYLRLDFSSLSDGPGVYLFKNRRGQILYIGQSGHLSQRLKSYFQEKLIGPKTKKLLAEATGVETICVSSPLEAILLEARLIQKHQPKYNLRGKDSKAFLVIRISTQQTVPVLSLVREVKADGATYFGPFPYAWLTKTLLRNIRHLFPYCTCSKGYQKDCFYRQLNLCQSPALPRTKSSLQAYRRTITQLIKFLKGDVSGYLHQLEHLMDELVQKEDFETAAKIRDQISHLEAINQKVSPPQAYLLDPNLAEDIHQQEAKDLKKVLTGAGLKPKKIKRIEAFDVSHWAGEGAVGSMVVFESGQPRLNHYRRFRIKAEATYNDAGMMAEVISRRFRKRSNKDKSFGSIPDLILVDGGANQVKKTLRVLQQYNLTIPLIGLEKRWETLVIPSLTHGKIKKIRLRPGTRSRLLLQRVRDEAHRFALSYQRRLREKLLFKHQ